MAHSFRLTLHFHTLNVTIAETHLPDELVASGSIYIAGNTRPFLTQPRLWRGVANFDEALVFQSVPLQYSTSNRKYGIILFDSASYPVTINVNVAHQDHSHQIGTATFDIAAVPNILAKMRYFDLSLSNSTLAATAKVSVRMQMHQSSCSNCLQLQNDLQRLQNQLQLLTKDLQIMRKNQQQSQTKYQNQLLCLQSVLNSTLQQQKESGEKKRLSSLKDYSKEVQAQIKRMALQIELLKAESELVQNVKRRQDQIYKQQLSLMGQKIKELLAENATLRLDKMKSDPKEMQRLRKELAVSQQSLRQTQYYIESLKAISPKKASLTSIKRQFSPRQ